MKFTTFIFLLGFCGSTAAKESLAVIEALNEYRSGQNKQTSQNINPNEKLSNLIGRIKNNQDLIIPPEEIILSLAIARDSPSANLVSPLKELWSHYRKSTYRAKYKDDWRYVKSLDFSQAICDEIKILVRKMGGNLDDIEPLEERNTYDLNQIRTELIKRNQDAANPLTPDDFQVITKKLSSILETCKLSAKNEDQKIQGFYFFYIVKAFENKPFWLDLTKLELNDPFFKFHDDLLTKCLSNIDSNWTPKTADKTPDEKKDEIVPSEEQIKIWHNESLKGYQQMNLPKLRDQILSNIAGIIASRKGDEDFKQALLKRFSKNEECAKTIKARLDALK